MSDQESARNLETSGFVFDPKMLLLRRSSTTQRAGGIVEQARLQAEQIVQEAQALSLQIQEEAEELKIQAREQGYRDGMNRAMEEWQSAIAEAVAERQNVVDQLENLTEHIESEVLKVALQVAEKIIRREVETNEDTVLQILRLAVRQLKDHANVRIWVNKDDLERVRSAREEIAGWVEGLRDVEIGEDPRVERGGVVVESPDGVLDARPSSQIKEIEKRLLETEDQ